MKTVTFIAIEEDGCRDGTYGYSVWVDNVEVIEYIGSGDLDVANDELDPVWKALGINVQFDWE